MCSSIPLFQRVVLQSGTASSANLERGAVISAVGILRYWGDGSGEVGEVENSSCGEARCRCSGDWCFLDESAIRWEVLSYDAEVREWGGVVGEVWVGGGDRYWGVVVWGEAEINLEDGRGRLIVKGVFVCGSTSPHRAWAFHLIRRTSLWSGRWWKDPIRRWNYSQHGQKLVLDSVEHPCGRLWFFVSVALTPLHQYLTLVLIL